MSSKDESTEKLINEITSKCNKDKIKVLWQNADDPYKRLWSLNADELGIALRYQNENIQFIPNRKTERICCICLKGYPGKEQFPKSGGKCKRCNMITYCSRECQLSDWKRHKKFCFK